jgi:hypothetical protein
MICFTIVLCFAACIFPDLLLAATQGGSNPISEGLGNLPQVVGVIAALSVASERLVEIVKGFIPPLNRTYDTSNREEEKKNCIRKSILQIMAVVSGIITAFLAKPAISTAMPNWHMNSLWHPLALGLLASGGSGFWNSINTYVLQAKNLKKGEVQKQVSG